MKRLLVILLFISLLFSCSQLLEGPNNNELPLNTVWDITPPPGVYAYNTPLSISIKSTAIDSVIKYTTDFSFPGLFNGIVYNGSFNVNRPTLLRVVAINGDKVSPVFEVKYDYKLPLPTFDKPGQVVNAATPVTISGPPEAGLTIRYTTDGSDPSTRIPDWITCFEGFSPQIPTINSTQTIRAIALHWEFQTSDVRTETYTYMPGLYVSKTGNDTTGTGTPQNPFLTIGKAMLTIGTGLIYVSAGQYTETVLLKANVGLLGGYRQGNWLDRNYQDRENPLYKTEIVSATNTITANNITGSEVQGFVITGNTEAILVSVNSNLTIRFNTINSTANLNSVGIRVIGGSISIIQYNIISGGNGSTTAYAIVFNTSNSGNYIKQNIIKGGIGSPTTSAGIYMTGLSAGTNYIYNNLIHGGNGATAYGIYIDSPNPSFNIINNTIISGEGLGNTTTSIYANNTNSCTIVNNVSSSLSTGTSTALFTGAGTFTVTHNTCGLIMLVGNLPVGSNNNSQAELNLDIAGRPTATSPAEVKIGGTDPAVFPGFTPSVDIQENPRPGSDGLWSRGCHEYQ